MSFKTVTDQMNNLVRFSFPPRRIISLVPSLTELLFDLGLEKRIVGITKFCVHPAHALATKANIGGTKNFHVDAIGKLEPDLIIGNKEENYAEGIARLQQRHPVWMSDICSYHNAVQTITTIGELTGRAAESRNLAAEIELAFSSITSAAPQRVLYLIWKKPWMAAGSKTFINDMIYKAGFVNVISSLRYPEITEEDIRQLKPDAIFLSSEPYPFKQNSAEALRKVAPQAKIHFVDGEMFSWYGSRMSQAPAYFSKIRNEMMRS